MGDAAAAALALGDAGAGEGAEDPAGAVPHPAATRARLATPIASRRDIPVRIGPLLIHIASPPPSGPLDDKAMSIRACQEPDTDADGS